MSTSDCDEEIDDCDLYCRVDSSSDMDNHGGGNRGGQKPLPTNNYVNLTHHHHHHHLSSDAEDIHRIASSTSSLPRREKSRPTSRMHSNTRKGRSRDRSDPESVERTSSNATTPVSLQSSITGDCIREREKELELIHRRSRELMLSPRILDCRTREASKDRLLDKNNVGGQRMVASSGISTSAKPPPLPPRLHSPPSTSQASSYMGRYKSPSPCNMSYHHHNHSSHHHHHQPPLPPTHSTQYRQSHQSLRKRVQSPNRRDFKDFSQPQTRDLRSPMKLVRSYLDEEEDSGADSLGNDQPGSLCSICYNHGGGSGGNMANALIAYEHHRPDSSICCSSYYPAISQPHTTSLSLGVEERLRYLEGDKDTLHIQVAALSQQIEGQTDKISDLEKILDDKKDVLRKTEDILSREILTRSSLETKKLELLSEIANLKLKQAATERENSELRKKLDFVTRKAEPSHVFSPSLFGTTPRRPRARSTNNNKTPSLPLETHFDYEDDDDSPKSLTDNRRNSPNHGGSAPNIAILTERKNPTSTFKRNYSRNSVEKTISSVVVSNPIATKPKGLKKIWGKMRRSNSGNLIEQEHQCDSPSNNNGKSNEAANKLSSNFTSQNRNSGGENPDSRYGSNGGSRFAGWMTSGGSGLPDPTLPFKQWKVDTIISWLDHLGLYMYSSEVRKHVKTGDDLIKMAVTNETVNDGNPLGNASRSDLVAKLGIKHVLHRKKLVLALNAKAENESNDLAGRLDHHWVVRWLDDVGLPQYKDTFLEARIDGRVLNFLTVEDLFHLKITNMLHHLSLRRGIQVLRACNFEPGCIKRRADPGDDKDRYSSPTEVTLWSNHRVMEWLRHIDLAEYASNLRGSGVHGALLVFEPRFNSELMASLLSIPVNKTLLRRHLTLHFRNLVGRDRMSEKREAQEGNNALLTPTAKVKTQKKNQFTLSRNKKSKNELDLDDLICPLEDE